jgi:hypothetical protein
MNQDKRTRVSRFNRRTKPPQVRIQARDIEILNALSSYRFLTTTQVTSLFFNTKKRAEHRLRKLYDAQLIDRIFRPVIKGSAEIIHILDRFGVNLLAEETGIDRGEINAARQKAKSLKSFFLNHFIEINQFRVSLTLAAQNQNYELLFWKYETELKNQNEQGILIADKVKDPENPSQRIPVAPDAFFGLGTPKGKTYFFLEVDRATMDNSRFKRKIKGYARYWLDGVFQEKWGYKAFRVLTTTTKRRRPNLMQTTSEIKEQQLLPIFYFTSRENITPEQIFNEIWQVPNDEKVKSIV